jgi:hypothetical protein
MKVYIFDKKKRKKVLAGNIQDATFIKDVKRKHFMRCKQGFGISDEVFPILQQNNVNYIQINCNGERRKCHILRWLHTPSKDFGHGSQKFVPWDSMTDIDKKQILLNIE